MSVSDSQRLTKRKTGGVQTRSTTYSGVCDKPLGLAGTAPLAIAAAVLVWGLSFGGAATQLQTAAGDVAGEGVDLANAMITTTWNAAIAAGGLLGGVLLGRWGAAALPPAALVLAGAALAVALFARRHAFTPGPRAAA